MTCKLVRIILISSCQLSHDRQNFNRQTKVLSVYACLSPKSRTQAMTEAYSGIYTLPV